MPRTIPTISREELRQLLERSAAVTVLDVRPAAERAEWSIPGGVHIDAYDALRRGDPGVLADFLPASGGPVVTVCAEGKTSLLTTEAWAMLAVATCGGFAVMWLWVTSLLGELGLRDAAYNLSETVPAWDPVAVTWTSALLGVAALGGAFIPAWRAAFTPPAALLQS